MFSLLHRPSILDDIDLRQAIGRCRSVCRGYSFDLAKQSTELMYCHNFSWMVPQPILHFLFVVCAQWCHEGHIKSLNYMSYVRWYDQNVHIVCTGHFNQGHVSHVGRMSVQNHHHGIFSSGLRMAQKVIEPGRHKYFCLHPS